MDKGSSVFQQSDGLPSALEIINHIISLDLEGVVMEIVCEIVEVRCRRVDPAVAM
jgi:hypothetical protein